MPGCGLMMGAVDRVGENWLGAGLKRPEPSDGRGAAEGEPKVFCADTGFATEAEEADDGVLSRIAWNCWARVVRGAPDSP